MKQIDFVFTENGTVAFSKGAQFHDMDLKQKFSEEQLQEFINFVLKYIADLEIPVKRGCFLEFRRGMMNVSPIGRNCSQ